MKLAEIAKNMQIAETMKLVRGYDSLSFEEFSTQFKGFADKEREQIHKCIDSLGKLIDECKRNSKYQNATIWIMNIHFEDHPAVYGYVHMSLYIKASMPIFTDRQMVTKYGFRAGESNDRMNMFLLYKFQ